MPFRGMKINDEHVFVCWATPNYLWPCLGYAYLLPKTIPGQDLNAGVNGKKVTLFPAGSLNSGSAPPATKRWGNQEQGHKQAWSQVVCHVPSHTLGHLYHTSVSCSHPCHTVSGINDHPHFSTAQHLRYWPLPLALDQAAWPHPSKVP